MLFKNLPNLSVSDKKNYKTRIIMQTVKIDFILYIVSLRENQ